MKFRLCVSILFLFVVGINGVVLGEECPKCDGNDVLIPASVIFQIPNYSPQNGTYAACDENSWGGSTKYVMEEYQLIREGDFFRARNMARKRFHPIQLSDDGKPLWAKLERVYKIHEDSCIDMSEGSPCFKCCN